MPYQTHSGSFEHAHPLGHVPTVQHPLVIETLQRYQIPASRANDVAAIEKLMLDPSALEQPGMSVTLAVATDSSPHEEVVDPAFPSTRVLFMQISAVLVDLLELNTREGGFVDPTAIREALDADVLASALPSSNLFRVDGLDPVTAFREEVDRLFRESRVEDRSLLDMLLEIEAHQEHPLVPPGYLTMKRCANPDCDAALDDPNEYVLPVGNTHAVCPACKTPVMAIDSMRAHEAFAEHGSNIEASNRVLSVAERLVSLILIEDWERVRPSMLGTMAFVTDGPLALFGQVAPIKTPMLRWMQHLAQRQMARTFDLPVIVGIEKTGAFADHARAICPHIEDKLRREGRLDEGALVVLDDAYTQTYITFRDSPHGKDTYYGRHFLYRSRTGAMYTITVPPLGRLGALPTDDFDARDYPTLRATCEVLDVIGTRLYPDATIPVALAHQFAAYPLRSAGRVLKKHAARYLNREELPATP